MAKGLIVVLNPLIYISIALGVFTQTVSGFGMALVAMPLLIQVIDDDSAATLVILVGMVVKLIMLLRYRNSLTIQLVWRLVAAAVIAIPIGVAIQSRVPGEIVQLILGIAVLFYAALNLLRPQLPAFEGTHWAYGFGFLGGLLAGAFSVGGPPAVIYASGKRWPMAAFKSNLQAYAIATGIVVIVTRWHNGDLTPEVWQMFIIALPAMAIAQWAAFKLDAYIDADRFRKIVLFLLIIVGLQLVF